MKRCYENLDEISMMDSKHFWKTKLLPSDELVTRYRIYLTDKDEIVKTESEMGETLDSCFLISRLKNFDSF